MALKVKMKNLCGEHVSWIESEARATTRRLFNTKQNASFSEPLSALLDSPSVGRAVRHYGGGDANTHTHTL